MKVAIVLLLGLFAIVHTSPLCDKKTSSTTDLSGRSQKYKKFVSEPIGDKPVTDLPGIGEAYGSRLEAAGYAKASQILDQFLELNKDKASFQKWMKEVSKATSKKSEEVYDSLNDWSDAFM